MLVAEIPVVTALSMSEFSIIKQYFSSLGAGKNVLLSVGDDAAALRVDEGCELIVSTDTSTAGVHFPDDLFPEDIAYKSVAAAASDLAAMGASPLGMTLAISCLSTTRCGCMGFRKVSSPRVVTSNYL